MGDCASETGNQVEYSAEKVADKTEKTAGIGIGVVLNDNVNGTGVPQLADQIGRDLGCLGKRDGGTSNQGGPEENPMEKTFHDGRPIASLRPESLVLRKLLILRVRSPEFTSRKCGERRHYDARSATMALAKVVLSRSRLIRKPRKTDSTQGCHSSFQRRLDAQPFTLV
jgi:hypothetical protein